jgi:hypothetical protein
MSLEPAHQPVVRRLAACLGFLAPARPPLPDVAPRPTARPSGRASAHAIGAATPCSRPMPRPREDARPSPRAAATAGARKKRVKGEREVKKGKENKKDQRFANYIDHFISNEKKMMVAEMGIREKISCRKYNKI